MDPVTIGLILSAATGVAKAGVGAWQFGKGRRMERETVRPEYEIPTEVFEALRSVQGQMGQYELPGQDLIEQNLGESTAGAIRSAREFSASPAAATQAAIQAYSSEMREKRNLGISAATRQDRLKDTYRQVLGLLSEYRDKAFDINEMQPYEASVAAASAMKGAGIQNLLSGFSDVVGVGVNAIDGGMIDRLRESRIQSLIEKNQAPEVLSTLEGSVIDNTYFSGSEEAALEKPEAYALLELLGQGIFTNIGG